MNLQNRIKRLKICMLVCFLLAAVFFGVLIVQLALAQWQVLKIKYLLLFFICLLAFGVSLIAVSLCGSRISVLKYDLLHTVRCVNCGMECFDNNAYCPACGHKMKKDENL